MNSSRFNVVSEVVLCVWRERERERKKEREREKFIDNQDMPTYCCFIGLGGCEPRAELRKRQETGPPGVTAC